MAQKCGRWYRHLDVSTSVSQRLLAADRKLSYYIYYIISERVSRGALSPVFWRIPHFRCWANPAPSTFSSYPHPPGTYPQAVSSSLALNLQEKSASHGIFHAVMEIFLLSVIFLFLSLNLAFLFFWLFLPVTAYRHAKGKDRDPPPFAQNARISLPCPPLYSLVSCWGNSSWVFLSLATFLVCCYSRPMEANDIGWDLRLFPGTPASPAESPQPISTGGSGPCLTVLHLCDGFEWRILLRMPWLAGSQVRAF